MHAGEEGVAPGGAALLGVVVHEHRTFIADAIDVGRLADHQAAMVDPRLHPADVIAHDEEDVWLLSRSLGMSLCRPKPSPQRTGRKQSCAAEQTWNLYLMSPPVTFWVEFSKLRFTRASVRGANEIVQRT